MRNYPFLQFVRQLDDFFESFDREVSNETKKDLELHLVFAGLTREDVAIYAEGQQVSITVTKTDLPGVLNAYAGYKRTYRIDPSYDLYAMEAKMSNGLLSIKIPLKEQLKPKQFQIAVN
jgi:HSP20 family molecular chaperone IbpA